MLDFSILDISLSDVIDAIATGVLIGAAILVGAVIISFIWYAIIHKS